MTSWWKEPYATGPTVPVLGFPRPLYPPDAAEYGKRPSQDGPDVVAYKRTVSRAGRWLWAAFDDSYSNGFSHGKGPNVIDTGVAGVQRQMHIDTTGWIGQATFEVLRKIRVPDGKPHAGEPCMDATAQKLLDEAFKLYGGHEPDDSLGTVRLAALARARGQIGVKESPPGSNNQKFGDWYGMNGVPWCAIFVTWCFELGAKDIAPIVDSPSFAAGARYSYVPYVVSDARNLKYGLKTTDDPVPGDLVCYDWDVGGDGIYDHIGIFEEWDHGSTFSAIEGNTSTSSDSNGGQVMRRLRDRHGQNTVFVRVAEP